MQNEIPPELLTERDIDHSLNLAATNRALETPLPGSLKTAFGPNAIDVCGVRVRKVVAGDWEIWTMLDSPVLKMVLEVAKPEGARDEVPSTAVEEWELIYQFTHPCADVYELVSKDRNAFRELVRREIGHDEEMSEKLQPLVFAIMEQFKRHLETRLKYMAEAEGKGDITFFRDTKENPRTG